MTDGIQAHQRRAVLSATSLAAATAAVAVLQELDPDAVVPTT